jgi:hypothetical protein
MRVKQRGASKVRNVNTKGFEPSKHSDLLSSSRVSRSPNDAPLLLSSCYRVAVAWATEVALLGGFWLPSGYLLARLCLVQFLHNEVTEDTNMMLGGDIYATRPIGL